MDLDIYEPLALLPYHGLSSIHKIASDDTRIDWKETPQAYIFKVDLHGIEKEEVIVEEVKASFGGWSADMTLPKIEEKEPQFKTIYVPD